MLHVKSLLDLFDLSAVFLIFLKKHATSASSNIQTWHGPLALKKVEKVGFFIICFKDIFSQKVTYLFFRSFSNVLTHNNKGNNFSSAQYLSGWRLIRIFFIYCALSTLVSLNCLTCDACKYLHCHRFFLWLWPQSLSLEVILLVWLFESPWGISSQAFNTRDVCFKTLSWVASREAWPAGWRRWFCPSTLLSWDATWSTSSSSGAPA